MDIKKVDFALLNEKIDVILDTQRAQLFPTHDFPRKKVGYAIYNEHGEILGGITASIDAQSLHINGLALDSSLRRQGYGQKLIDIVESYAKTEQVHMITLSTQDYQAVGFYQKMGYEIFATLADYPFVGTTKHYFKKLM